MSSFRVELGPTTLGAEALVRLARERLTGVLDVNFGDRSRQLLVVQGRPERVVDGAGRQSADRQQVRALVHAVAAMASGIVTFVPSEVAAEPSLGLDTLGEVLLALARTLPVEQAKAYWEARADTPVKATERFVRLSSTIAQLGGPAVAIPPNTTPSARLIARSGPEALRAWVALSALGGVTFLAAPDTAAPPSAAEETALGPTATPEARALAATISRVHAGLSGLTYYELLQIDPKAAAETVRGAYLELARRYHSDRLAGLGLGPEVRAKADVILQQASEAARVLGDAEERQAYDVMIERKAQGLPTDVSVILEAEALFRRAQAIVRRGQAAAALPLLRQAVELNRGEPEFWAYFGFALYSAGGKEALAEAREAIRKALEMSPKLAMAEEFLGRIARVEGQLNEAASHFRKALELNPNSREAELELRLVSTRAAKAKTETSGLGSLLGRLLGK